MNAGARAVFLDRDGTLIEDVSYIASPDDVRLIDGAASAVARLNAAFVPVVIVTNQSGIGRGYFSLDDYFRVHARLEDLLAESGARVDGIYHCPHAADEQCDCRKPGTLLFRRAAEDLGLDLTTSWFIGDRLRDVEPALDLGGTGVLIPASSTPAGDLEMVKPPLRVTATLDEAVSMMLGAGSR